MQRVAIVSASSDLAGTKRLTGGFPANYRLRQAAEFSAVFSRRKVVRGRWFHVHVLPRSSGLGARLGLVVPKKLLRTAVARNLAKRMVREAFRKNRDGLADNDFVFRLAARPGSNPRKFDRRAVSGEIARLVAGLISKSGN